MLVTGGAGFIGSNLTLTLQKDNNNITVIDNLFSSNKDSLQDFRGEVVIGDVTSIDFSQFKNIELIFHEASITDTTRTDDKEMIDMNLGGFKRVLEFVLRQKATLVYASSAGVYGRGACPMREDQPLAPQNAYARSKMLMDEEAVKYKDKIRIVGLRYFNVYGPGEKYKKKAASMIWQLASQMKANKNPRIFKYGEQSRDFIYVKDVVAATIKAASAPRSGIANVGTGTATTFNRIIEILNQILGTSFEPEYFDNPYSFYQNETKADTAKARQLLGFQAGYSIEEGIRDYFTSTRF
jgi:ADP-L-glycero-D-manno-heptose 6-epimerase